MLPTVLLLDVQPSPGLVELVRKFQVFRFAFEKSSLPPVKYYAPRPEHSLTFYTQDPQRSKPVQSGTAVQYPRSVFNGIYTEPLYRYGSHDFCAIKVVFQPTALARLGVVAVNELTNRHLDAEDVLGKEIAGVTEQLASGSDLRKMIGIIEAFLLRLQNRNRRNPEPIDRAATYLLGHDGNCSIDWLAREACLSPRQLIRVFQQRLGVSPKLFQKIIRFDRAFRLKNNHPELDWLTVALHCGYYDYQHLARDFRAFTLLSPPAFYEVDKTSPERAFALHEG